MTDPTSASVTTIGIGAICAGLTQKLRDFGIQGEWLTLCSVGIGVICAYLSVFNPSLWEIVVPVLIPLTVSGGVSFVKSVTGN